MLEGFDANGKPTLRPPRTPLTVRQLLSHTSGFGYEFFDEKLARYVASGAVPSMMTGDDGFLQAPLLFDPGKVDRGPKQRVFDLPGGQPRLSTAPVGVEGVWVNGVRLSQGALPGRLLRDFAQ